MNNNPKKQHYVPQCYLKEFATRLSIDGKEPLIWIFNRDSRKGRLDKVKNVLFAKDLYTVDVGGEKDYSIETSLGNVESEYTKVYRDKIKNRLPLNEVDLVVFCAFISALMQRTLRHKESIEGFMSEVIEKMEAMDTAHNTHSRVVEDYKKMRENSHKMGILKLLPDITEVLVQMNLAFITADKNKSKYITCDDPCIMFNPDLQWQKFYGYGLAQKSIELTITLSPDTMAIFSWSNLKGYASSTDKRIDNHNRMVRNHAYKYFLVNSPKTKLLWFSKYPLSVTFLIKVAEHRFFDFMKLLKYKWTKRNY